MSIKETVSRVLSRGGEGDAPAPDALTLIKSDHREVDALFAEALADGATPAKQRSLAAKITKALTAHANMEEALFYPALRKAGGTKERDSVLEAAEEHAVVKDLIAKIERITGRDETLEAKLTVLKELVHHHVGEEEGEIFGEARKALGEDRLQKLGEEMQRFKERALRAAGARPARRGAAAKKKKAVAKAPARKAAAKRKRR